MTPQELRASILNLAIQGKLVEHFASELPVAVDTSFCGDTSDFFEIPENWKWLSIKDVASVNTGLSFKKQDQRDSSNGSLRVLRGGNIGDDYKYHLYEDDVYVELDQFQTKYIQLIEGDVITPSVTSIEKICKTGYVDRDLPSVTAGGFVYIIRCLDRSVIEPKYLLYFISSFFNKEQCKPNIHKSGQAFYNLKKSGFIEQPICVPPLAEQKRIVAKIEELFPYIDRYERAWRKLEEVNKRFPVDMQKSILQMAIQGKLVEQRSEEGTGEELYQQIQAEKQKLIKEGKIKKEKPLPEITEDEVPFDIPESWKWVRLSKIISVLGDGIHGTPIFDETGDYYFVNGNNLAKGNIVFKADSKRVSFDEYEKHKKPLDENTILISINGTIGNYAFYAGEPIILGKSACYFSVLTGIDKEYIRHIINTKYFMDYAVKEATQTTIKNVSLKAMRMLPVPLPPLAEQKRIVAKLEEILPLCERLK